MVINDKSITILSHIIAFFSLGSFDSGERMAADGFERAKLPADWQGNDGTRGKACGRGEDEVLGWSAPGLLETLHRGSITPQGRALRTLSCFASNEYHSGLNKEDFWLVSKFINMMSYFDAFSIFLKRTWSIQDFLEIEIILKYVIRRFDSLGIVFKLRLFH